MMTAEQAAEQLSRSERGRRMLLYLGQMMDDGLTGLDSTNQAALAALLVEIWQRPMTVLDLLRPVARCGA